MPANFLNKSLIKGSIPLTLIICFQNCGPGETSYAAISQPARTSNRSQFQVLPTASSTKGANSSGQKGERKVASLVVSGITVDRSNPNVYLLSLHKAPSLMISLPNGVILENRQLTLTKLRGNCPKATPQSQTLQAEWKETEATKSSAVIPYLQSREIWNEQLQGCDFELKARGEASGEIHEYRAILDARVCSDGEHTQLSQFAEDCQTQGPARNYLHVRDRQSASRPQ